MAASAIATEVSMASSMSERASSKVTEGGGTGVGVPVGIAAMACDILASTCFRLGPGVGVGAFARRSTSPSRRSRVWPTRLTASCRSSMRGSGVGVGAGCAHPARSKQTDAGARRTRRLRIESEPLKSLSLPEPEHQVHVLDGLARRALYQVVDAAHHDEPARTMVHHGVDDAGVASQGVLSHRRLIHHVDERGVLVEGAVRSITWPWVVELSTMGA